MKTSLILEKVNYLRGVLDPNTVDGNPGQPGPIFSTAIANYVVAEILRDISANLKDKTVATQVRSIGKELAAESSKGLIAGWEDGDDICPPYHLHFPFPKPGPGPDPWQTLVQLMPRPEPWLNDATPALNDVVLAVAIRQLASLTTSDTASAALKQAGETIVKGASGRIFDEYCGTPIKPHVPVRLPQRTAA